MVLTYSWVEALCTVLFADKCPASLAKRTITLHLTLGIELQYTSLHELQLHVWLGINWQYFQLGSVLFRFNFTANDLLEIVYIFSDSCVCVCMYSKYVLK